MSYLTVQSPIKKIGPALVAGMALFLAGATSISGLNLFGSHYGFGFLPLLILVIWPRRANTILSLALVFLAGLFVDWATGGARGECSLIFVLVWGFLRPECRSTPFAPVSLFLVWLLICGLAIIILSITGYFIHGIMPDVVPLFRQMILATLILPILILLRRAISHRLNEYDDWG